MADRELITALIQRLRVPMHVAEAFAELLEPREAEIVKQLPEGDAVRRAVALIVELSTLRRAAGGLVDAARDFAAAAEIGGRQAEALGAASQFAVGAGQTAEVFGPRPSQPVPIQGRAVRRSIGEP